MIKKIWREIICMNGVLVTEIYFFFWINIYWLFIDDTDAVTSKRTYGEPPTRGFVDHRIDGPERRPYTITQEPKLPAI